MPSYIFTYIRPELPQAKADVPVPDLPSAPKLLPADWFHFIRTAGPLKDSVPQSLIKKYKSVTFPQQCFDSITSFSTEQIQSQRE